MNTQRRNVFWLQVCSIPDQSQRVSPLAGLDRGVRADLDHDGRLHLGEGLLGVAPCRTRGLFVGVRDMLIASGQVCWWEVVLGKFDPRLRARVAG